MPSDSNGVYTLPDGYLAVTGQTIQASQHNPPLEDLASSMTQRLMRSGAAPMTGPLKVVDGSVGSPSVQFSNGSSTGVYKTTNGIGFSVDGVKVAELVAGGFVTGARWVGELIPFTGLTAPALTVLPYGQTLSRTTYAALWAFAQTEIAAGNTFYNNGDGSTTFGIGDVRGRVVAGKDNMGGSAAGRLSSGGGVTGTTLGAAGGAQLHTLTTTEMPAHTHEAVVDDPSHSHPGGSSSAKNGQGGTGGLSVFWVGGTTLPTSFELTGIQVSNNNTGGGGPHPNVQPTIITNYILFAGA